MKQEIIDEQMKLAGRMKDEKIKAIRETEQELHSAIIEIASRLERIAHFYVNQIGKLSSSCSSITEPFDEHNGVAIEFCEENGNTIVKVELRNKAGVTYTIRDEDPYLDFYQAKDYFKPVKNVFYQYSIAAIVLKWLKIYEYDICSAIADSYVSNKTVTSGYEETYYIDDIKGE